MNLGEHSSACVQPSSVMNVKGLSGTQPKSLNTEDKGKVPYVKVSLNYHLSLE